VHESDEGRRLQLRVSKEIQALPSVGDKRGDLDWGVGAPAEHDACLAEPAAVEREDVRARSVWGVCCSSGGILDGRELLIAADVENGHIISGKEWVKDERLELDAGVGR
jgi:hypothetical protein